MEARYVKQLHKHWCELFDPPPLVGAEHLQHWLQDSNDPVYRVCAIYNASFFPILSNPVCHSQYKTFSKYDDSLVNKSYQMLLSELNSSSTSNVKNVIQCIFFPERFSVYICFTWKYESVTSLLSSTHPSLPNPDSATRSPEEVWLFFVQIADFFYLLDISSYHLMYFIWRLCHFIYFLIKNSLSSQINLI